MTRVAELELGGGSDAVPRARQFVSSLLVDHPADAVDDAGLIVTELVTNASLHGTPPVLVRVATDAAHIRLEVQDGGQNLPVMPARNTQAMTGRGLRLVAALAGAWGVESAGASGKTVWAELGGDGTPGPADDTAEPDLEGLLAAWSDEDADEQRYTVRLGAVPTDLLLDAKAHIDNVIREVRLANGNDPELRTSSADDDSLAAVALSFSSAREQIKRQALAAAANGEVETTLVLTLPAAAADSGERYLAALDRADQHARHAQLLTLETPALHKLFRRWYVQALVDQLRARAAGDELVTSPTFVQVLAREMSTVTRLRDAADRLELLQTVASELTATSSVDQIADVVIDQATQLLGALAGQLMVVSGTVLRSVGTGRARAAAQHQEVPLDADLPGPSVVRSGEALALRNWAQLAERFPELTGHDPVEGSLHVAPMIIDNHLLGVLSLSFPAGGRLDLDAQARFVRALADAAAQAVERAQAMQALRGANERLAFVADASVSLSADLDLETTVANVGSLLVPRLADWCVVQVLRGGRLRTVGIRHVDPAKAVWAERMSELYPADVDAPTGAAQVLRTGCSELYPQIPDALLTASATSPEHLAVLRELGMSSACIVPMAGRRGVMGTLALVYAESGRQYEPADLPFVEDVARRAAVALETAQLLDGRLGPDHDVHEAEHSSSHPDGPST